MPVPIRRLLGRLTVLRAIRLMLAVAIGSPLPLGLALRAADAGAPDHLVVSEVVTGGASASDEFIELYNPTAGPLPLEGLEVIYVSASGATLTRRAAWDVGAPEVPAGRHVLVANAGGIFAPIADATYLSGMAATGGSVGVRILGAATTIDAVGWGTATGDWPEGAPAVAPAAGTSIERLPGAASGGWQDTDDNATDFAMREIPEPQNLGSAPTPATQPGLPTPEPPTPEPSTPDPAPSVPPPGQAAIPIAVARTMADGATVTIEGVTLTGSAFHDGGGFVADASAGIAVLVTGGTFERGSLVRVTGELDDRFSQRTLRADGTSLQLVGPATAPGPATMQTGEVGEDAEGRLVRVGGRIVGSVSTLTTGVALDLDDGSGATRVVVGTGSGIETAAWKAGTTIDLVGVAGQRDSTGSGTTGYRVLPRDPTDVVGVVAPSATPAPSTPVAAPSADPGETPSDDLVSIAAARAAPKNARLGVRGVVTLPSGVVDAETAVIQDASGAIVLRLGGDVGDLRLGQRIEVSGTRSTKSGMETLRVTTPARHLGAADLPSAAVVRTGDAGEAREATLVSVRGALVASARRAPSGSASFDLDDGSGPLKVVIGASLAPDTTQLREGTWIEVRAVLGQQTTGSQPRDGYRLWPSSLAAIRIIAPAGDDEDAEGGSGGAGPEPDLPNADLGDLGQPDLADLRVGATLVVGPWEELHIGGLLWDGSSLVAIERQSADLVASAIGSRHPPVALELGGLISRGNDPASGLPMVAISTDPGDTIPGSGLVAAPQSRLTPTPAWASVIGRTGRRDDASSVRVRGRLARLELRCSGATTPAPGPVSVTGIALADPLRLIVPCGGLRPVPRLSSGPPRAAIPDREPAGAAAVQEEAPTPIRPLAAGLLLAAGSTLVIVALWRRLRGGSGDPRAGDATSSAPEEGSSDGEHDQEPPRLTLVGVPREHGP